LAEPLRRLRRPQLALHLVERTLRNGRVKPPKTKASVRAVPLHAIALAAVDQLPGAPESPLPFPSARGAYLDLHNFRNRSWKPAQTAAGISPLCRVYDLRHTFATFALRAGISTFDLSRYMGTSPGHDRPPLRPLARDGREHAIKLLDSYQAAETLDVHPVNAPWTPNQPLDAKQTSRRGAEQAKSRSRLSDSNR
jgi:integrase